MVKVNVVSGQQKDVNPGICSIDIGKSCLPEGGRL